MSKTRGRTTGRRRTEREMNEEAERHARQYARTRQRQLGMDPDAGNKMSPYDDREATKKLANLLKEDPFPQYGKPFAGAPEPGKRSNLGALKGKAKAFLMKGMLIK